MGIQNKTKQFIAVLESHKGIIYKVVNLYCKNAEERKDLAQDIIFQLWKSFNDYDAEFKYATWIYRIALNVAISFYRKKVARMKVVNPCTSNDIFTLADSPETGESALHLKKLYQLISGLKEIDKAIILLHLEEKTYREIAEIIGLTETNVATKISRIKLELTNNFRINK